MKCFVQDLSLSDHSYLDLFLHGVAIVWNLPLSFAVTIKSIPEFKWYKNLNDTFKWTGWNEWKNFWKDRKFFVTVLKSWQKSTCGIAAFLKTLHAAIIFQIFFFILRKCLVLLERFCRYIYAEICCEIWFWNIQNYTLCDGTYRLS